MNDEGNQVRVSLRTRADFDVSALRFCLAAEATSKPPFQSALPLAEAEAKVLITVRDLLKVS
jgi:hypothetical protein